MLIHGLPPEPNPRLHFPVVCALFQKVSCAEGLQILDGSTCSPSCQEVGSGGVRIASSRGALLLQVCSKRRTKVTPRAYSLPSIAKAFPFWFSITFVRLTAWPLALQEPPFFNSLGGNRPILGHAYKPMMPLAFPCLVSRPMMRCVSFPRSAQTTFATDSARRAPLTGHDLGLGHHRVQQFRIRT